jgi:hypothetical protein
MSEPDFLDDEVDLDDVRDSQGRRIDSDYVERAVADVRARRGRPSLSSDPANEPHHSPHVSLRIPEQTRRLLDERARIEGRKLSEIVREALEQYLNSHPTP